MEECDYCDAITRSRCPPSRSLTELCHALQQNDAGLTSVCTHGLTVNGDDTDTQLDYGQQLGHALQSNTTASSLHLNIASLCSSTHRVDETGESNSSTMSSLLGWIQRSLTLQKVIFSRTSSPPSPRNANDLTPNETILLKRMLQAVARNPNIRAFEARVIQCPLPVWTNHFLSNTASSSTLTSLNIEVPYEASEIELRAAARAVGRLSSLQVLGLYGIHPQPFLRQLQSSSLSSRTLQRLTVDTIATIDWRDSFADDLSSVLTHCPLLNDVTIGHFDLHDPDCWSIVSSGLQSNPSIVTLRLVWIDFCSNEASTLFLSDLQSKDASLQHVRNLYLDSCTFQPVRRNVEAAVGLVEMIRDSLLHHVTLDVFTMESGDEFVDLLNTNAKAIKLRSMELKNIDFAHWLFLSRNFLSTTVHLQHLKLRVRSLETLNSEELNVPLSFLRRNGSLYSLNVVNSNETRYPRDDKTLRWIEAKLTRNRLLPELLTTTFGSNHSTMESFDSLSVPEEVESRPLPSRHQQHVFPTLCVVALQAQRMALGALLQGFLAAADGLDAVLPLANQSRKRKASHDIEREGIGKR